MARPGGGSSRSAFGSVDERVCEETPDLLWASGVGAFGLAYWVVEYAPDVGREGSVRSEMILSRIWGSWICPARGNVPTGGNGARDEDVGV